MWVHESPAGRQRSIHAKETEVFLMIGSLRFRLRYLRNGDQSV